MNSLSSGNSSQLANTGGIVSSGGAPKSINIAETVKQLELKIGSVGPGPHTQQQKEELVKLNGYLQRTKLEQQKMMNAGKIPGDSPIGSATSSPMISVAQSPTVSHRSVAMSQGTPNGAVGAEGRVLDKRRLQELVKEVDPLEQMDDDVEEVLLQIADDFIENVVTAACQIAKHRKSNTLEVKDVQLHLERSWNMWVPGFGAEEIRPYKKVCVTEAHKQRMALIRKTLKKY